MHAIICEDPTHRLNIGTVIEGANEIAQLKRKGCTLLPYDRELPSLANTGYVQNFRGKGWLLDRNVGERGCPSMLHITSSCRFIYWAAKVKPLDPSQPWGLKMRMVHSSDNQHGMGRGINQVEHVKQPPSLDDSGCAVVYGKLKFNTQVDGFLFTDLYANASNAVVVWDASTQHYQDYLWSSAG